MYIRCLDVPNKFGIYNNSSKNKNKHKKICKIPQKVTAHLAIIQNEWIKLTLLTSYKKLYRDSWT